MKTENTLTILQLIFITLKLTDLIDWSWFWVLSPFWISIAIYTLITIIMLIINKFK